MSVEYVNISNSADLNFFLKVVVGQPTMFLLMMIKPLHNVKVLWTTEPFSVAAGRLLELFTAARWQLQCMPKMLMPCCSPGDSGGGGDVHPLNIP